MAKPRVSSFRVDERIGEVSSLTLRPRGSRAVFVLAHGAGAGMQHAFMEAFSEAMGQRGIATFRYQFPYMEHQKRRPDRHPVLLATVRAAIRQAKKLRLPMFAGGKSMGGRMTSMADAEEPLPEVGGLIFLGFPLHRPGGPSAERGEHLKASERPMLFLQGERDELADLSLLRPLCKKLGRRATLHVIEQGDHSFSVPKRTGLSPEDVMDDLADTTAAWIDRRLG